MVESFYWNFFLLKTAQKDQSLSNFLLLLFHLYEAASVSSFGSVLVCVARSRSQSAASFAGPSPVVAAAGRELCGGGGLAKRLPICLPI